MHIALELAASHKKSRFAQTIDFGDAFSLRNGIGLTRQA
tara:strand:- start:457 stop:573 length:117 start_codon:yes stop_codon:yes gene_type:complete